jgi:hypothetical protein
VGLFWLAQNQLSHSPGVAAFVAGAEALREAKRRYPWLEVLLVEVLLVEVLRNDSKIRLFEKLRCT